MNLLLFVTGAAVIYCLQWILSRSIWNYRLSADALFSEKQVMEGDRAELTIQVENRKLAPVPAVKVNVKVDLGLDFLDQNNLAISDKNYRSEIFSLRAHERVIREIPLHCRKRGYYSIEGIDLVGNDLFYSSQFISGQTTDCNIAVLPGKVDPRQLMTASQKMIGETVVPTSDSSDPFTFRGIRQYQPFDSIRQINWNASARTGDLQVNMHDFTTDQEIALILDTQWDALLKPDGLLEESIRIAAALADEFIGKGVMTSLETNGSDCLTGQEIQVAPGASPRHSQVIRQGLARLVIAQHPQETLVDLLKGKTAAMKEGLDRHRSVVLISTQSNDRVRAQWKEMCEYAVRAIWIIPAHSSKDLPGDIGLDPDIMIWEVPHGI